MLLLFLAVRAHHARRHGGEVQAGALDLQRVFREGVLLHALDILVHTGGERKDERDADDADGTGEGCEQGARLLAAQVLEAERERREQRHRGMPRPFFVLRLLFSRRRGEGVRVGADHTVAQPHDARGIGLRQLRVVRHHHHQPVARHLLEQLHHLHARLAVERAGRLVGQEHVGVVYEGARNRHALHLPAGKLVRPLVQVLAQAHLLERGHRALAPLRAGDAGNRERELHIRKDRLVGDQVVALKDEAHRVVAVGVPVPVGVALRGNAVDHEIAAVVAIQPADDVEQRRLAGAAGPQDGHKLAVAEAEVHVVERLLREASRPVLFADLFDL